MLVGDVGWSRMQMLEGVEWKFYIIFISVVLYSLCFVFVFCSAGLDRSKNTKFVSRKHKLQVMFLVMGTKNLCLCIVYCDFRTHPVKRLFKFHGWCWFWRRLCTSEKLIWVLIFRNCVSPWNPTKTPILPNFIITGSSTNTCAVRIQNSESCRGPGDSGTAP